MDGESEDMRTKRSGGKYHAKKTVVDGLVFASIKESERYLELKLMQASGIIKSFTCQPRFVLQEKYKRKDGKRIRAIEYVGDFEVEYPDGRVEIEDVKTKGTCKIPTFLLKQKILEKVYPDINFKVVMK